MAEQGGYRKPTTPAAVSGPGAFSQRTDGQPGTTPKQAQRYVGGGEYGTNKAFNEEVVAGAPMAAAPTMAEPGSAPVPTFNGPAAPMPAPLTAPTERPDEPLTAGMAFGEGPGPEILRSTQEDQMATNGDLKRAKNIQDFLEKNIDRSDVSGATRQLVRKLRAMNINRGI